jgi:hypothetical protein
VNEEEDSFEPEEEDVGLFKEERDVVQGLFTYMKKNIN